MDRAICRAGPISKIDKKIFGLGAPVRGNCNFDAGAGGPAGFGRAADGVERKVGLDVAESSAAGAIDKKAVESIASAAARRGKPSVLGQATSGAEAGGAGGGEGTEATRVGPVAIGLDAEHPRANLVVGAKRPAENKPGGIENIA